MLRTVVKADKQNISIKLPEEYIGKKVEIIAFTVEEPDVLTENTDKPVTHFASEKVLAKDWLAFEDDLAWQDL